ncbi:phasin family protein [Marinilactibacillus kalidii]|uniref:phasin family protein n=1 Tax=Marinilactibacillus kalidii TaxID=2820274 RepID=UPI001ABE72BD|nr:aspartyl beta-hydroxylase [Marinilactibacillus kalidii]
MLVDDIKKALLIGVGGTALAVEKSMEQIDRLVAKGKLSVEEGKTLTSELIQKKNQQTNDSEEKEKLEALLLDMNVAQRKDIDDLEAKVQELEKKLENNSLGK